MSTGRFIVGHDAPAQVGQTVRIPRFIVFLGGQSGRPDLGLCLRLLGPTPTKRFHPGFDSHNPTRCEPECRAAPRTHHWPVSCRSFHRDC